MVEVSVANVREVLVGIKAGQLPDATITRWIRVAGIIADGNKGEAVTEADRNDVVCTLASYYSLTSYATYLQTSGGRVPNAIIAQMTELSKVSSVLLSIISRAAGAMAPDGTLVVATGSIMDDDGS